MLHVRAPAEQVHKRRHSAANLVPQQVQSRDGAVAEHDVRKTSAAVGPDAVALEVDVGEAAAVRQHRAEQCDAAVRKGQCVVHTFAAAVQHREGVAVDLRDDLLQEDGLIIEGDGIAQGHEGALRNLRIVIYAQPLDGIVVDQRALQSHAPVIRDGIMPEADVGQGAVLEQHRSQQFDSRIGYAASVQHQCVDVCVGVQHICEHPQPQIRHVGIIEVYGGDDVTGRQSLRQELAREVVRCGFA
mmetsp:Transcript_25201/g.39848  ORF Transcript_25201/g.39848 Transcript_25201/m.39848 type:complete len:243 (-) Transcript_25201:2434-3162(-)